jgi:hypothetical protein
MFLRWLFFIPPKIHPNLQPSLRLVGMSSATYYNLPRLSIFADMPAVSGGDSAVVLNGRTQRDGKTVLWRSTCRIQSPTGRLTPCNCDLLRQGNLEQVQNLFNENWGFLINFRLVRVLVRFSEISDLMFVENPLLTSSSINTRNITNFPCRTALSIRCKSSRW